MYLLGLGLILLVLKSMGIGSVANWDWWLVMLPFALAVVWWAWADASGYSKRRAMDAMEAKRTERRRRNMEALGSSPKRK